jgi:flagellar hook-associated protein 2
MVGSIDTETIISQLMAVERKPQDLLKARVTTLQRQQTAWQSIADKLTALKTASDAVTGLDAMSTLRTVSSSNTNAIAVRSIGAGASSSSSIDVVALAAAKSVLGADVFGSATDSVGARTLDITRTGGSPVTITSTDGTIGGLAAAVNAANLGVSAKVLQTAPGQYQLSLTATSSGTAAAFTAAGTGWTSLDTVRDAADAQMRVDGVLMTRSSNVISDVLDGTELTLLGTTTGSVTVSSARDDAAITANVKALVDAANALNSIINTVTKTSTTESERGALAGDFAARQLMDSIRDAIAQPLKTAAGKITTSSALGISLNRDGTINFDPTALTASLASDPDTVLAVIGRNGFSTANGVSVIGVTSAATTSSRAITVTQAASQALLVGMVTPPPAPGTQVSMNIVTPSGTVSVSFVAGATNAETAANLNAALRAAGVKMTAVAQPSGSIDLREDRFGSNHSFSVTGGVAIGLNGAATDGTDATGTIDGVAFTATGKSLTSGGVVISIATTDTQLAAAGGTVSGTVSLTTGLAGVLSTVGARGSDTGSVIQSKTTLQDQIDDLNQRITRYDGTLKQHEDTLRTKFTAMQTMIDKLNSMQTPLNNLAASG